MSEQCRRNKLQKKGTVCLNRYMILLLLKTRRQFFIMSGILITRWNRKFYLYSVGLTNLLHEIAEEGFFSHFYRMHNALPQDIKRSDLTKVISILN